VGGDVLHALTDLGTEFTCTIDIGECTDHEHGDKGTGEKEYQEFLGNLHLLASRDIFSAFHSDDIIGATGDVALGVEFDLGCNAGKANGAKRLFDLVAGTAPAAMTLAMAV